MSRKAAFIILSLGLVLSLVTLLLKISSPEYVAILAVVFGIGSGRIALAFDKEQKLSNNKGV
jgi:Flp pilus assembly protein TadB